MNWHVIIEDIGPRLYRYFRARFSPEESSDLVQETLIRLVRKANQGSFQPERGTIAMYAFGIARYVTLEAKKSLRLAEPPAEWSRSESPPSDTSLDEKILREQEAQRTRKALNQLSEIQREIIFLMIDDELSLNDISVLLDLPVGTIKSHVHRAKEELRQILEKEIL
jgi:RNA polymerase sigma factor (sigma-70 family)